MTSITNNYYSLVSNQNNMLGVAFAFGCVPGAIENFNKIEKRPFWSCYRIAQSGCVYAMCCSILLWFEPKSKYFVIPCLMMSTIIMLWKLKNKQKLNVKKKMDDGYLIIIPE